MLCDTSLHARTSIYCLLLAARGLLTIYCLPLPAALAANNTGEASLEACMKSSMHPKGEGPVQLSYEQRKQAAIRAWEEAGP